MVTDDPSGGEVDDRTGPSNPEKAIMSETTPDELLIELEQMHEQAEAHADQLDDLAAEIPDPERIERIAKLLDITERIERLEENADLPEPEPENENERDLAANGRGPTNPWGSGGR